MSNLCHSVFHSDQKGPNKSLSKVLEAQDSASNLEKPKACTWPKHVVPLPIGPSPPKHHDPPTISSKAPFSKHAIMKRLTGQEIPFTVMAAKSIDASRPARATRTGGECSVIE